MATKTHMSHLFNALPCMLLTPPDSDLLALLLEADHLLEKEAHLLDKIDADLDHHAKCKKALRMQDAAWSEAHTQRLAGVEPDGTLLPPERLRLQQGRPRTPAYVVFMFLVGHAYFGGFKAAEAITLLQESMSLHIVMRNMGLKMPAASTVHELVNAVSNTTREAVLDAQIRQVLAEGWDDFSRLLQDSTAVEANSQWPTDSQLMVDLAARLLHRLSKLDGFDLSSVVDSSTAKVVGKMAELHKQISMGGGKAGSRRERNKLYRKLLTKARKALSLLTPYVERARQAIDALDILPSRKQRANRLGQWLQQDLDNLRRAIDCCHQRVIQDVKVPAKDKVYSVSDPDASMIVKGGREPSLGYKPQLSRSGRGFVVGLIVPKGNAADSGQLVPMFEQSVARTGVIPDEMSVDDGYASAEGREHLKSRGVRVVSISGSKGKRITPPEEWDDVDHAVARDGRSAVESLMFTIKHGFDFDRVARRGLQNVYADLLDKVLAYNLMRMAMCRRTAAQSAELLAA